MRRKLSTVIGKGRGKLTRAQFSEFTGISVQRIEQLLNGSRGEHDVWVEFMAEVYETKRGFKTKCWMDEITYMPKPPERKRISLKLPMMVEVGPSE